jgi:hypothetical protein
MSQYPAVSPILGNKTRNHGFCLGSSLHLPGSGRSFGRDSVEAQRYPRARYIFMRSAVIENSPDCPVYNRATYDAWSAGARGRRCPKVRLGMKNQSGGDLRTRRNRQDGSARRKRCVRQRQNRKPPEMEHSCKSMLPRYFHPQRNGTGPEDLP